MSLKKTNNYLPRDTSLRRNEINAYKNTMFFVKPIQLLNLTVIRHYEYILVNFYSPKPNLC